MARKNDKQKASACLNEDDSWDLLKASTSIDKKANGDGGATSPTTTATTSKDRLFADDPAEEKAGLFSLQMFSYATRLDKFLIILGLAMNAANGVSMVSQCVCVFRFYFFDGNGSSCFISLSLSIERMKPVEF